MVLGLAFLVLCGVLVDAQEQKLPDTFSLCRFSDEECLKQQANAFIRAFKDGVPGLGTKILDPFKIKSFRVTQGNPNDPSSGIQLDLNMKNVVIHGYSNAEMRKIKGFDENPSGKFLIEYRAPQVNTSSDYSIKGNIFGLPIEGEGKGFFYLENVRTKISFNGHLEEKNGKQYLKFDGTYSAADVKTTSLKFNLMNLFNGNEALGEAANLFLNEYWKQIFEVMKPVLIPIYAKIPISVASSVFDKVPYRQLFAQ